MLKTRRMIPLVIISALLFGCGAQNRKSGTANSQGAAAQNGSSQTAKRFQDNPLEGKTVVESAMELSEKYATLSDEAVKLRQERQQLLAENEDLKRQIAAAEVKLKQTQKELGEANQLLIEMLTELNNWKSNILGFRGEMREAAKAQLEALLKVLEILGGDAQANAIKQQHETTLRPPDQNTPQPAKTTVSKGKDQNEP